MKFSIISTIIATLLAASNTAPVDPLCQFEINILHQSRINTAHQSLIPVTFYGVDGASFTQEFLDDPEPSPIGK